MREFRWNQLKSARLKRTRGVSFDEITQEKLIVAREHPSRPEQQILLFERKGYIWVAPCVEHDKETFLKTLYPSRKYTKLYREGRL